MTTTDERFKVRSRATVVSSVPTTNLATRQEYVKYNVILPMREVPQMKKHFDEVLRANCGAFPLLAIYAS